MEAVAHGYRMYNNLVKDRWGLLCGLIYVITSRAQPELIGDDSRRVFEYKILQLVPEKITLEVVEEWVLWAQRIVADQTWVRKISSSDAKAIAKKSRTSSGIGNMITYSLMFMSQRKLDDYNEWKKDLVTKISRESPSNA
jgi:hypothetical protein